MTGSSEDGITFDWGVAAALLFGRQKASISHSTMETKFNKYQFNYPNEVVYHLTTPPISRHRSIVVPNVGGFAGISFRRANAKVSFGYRGDFFFGAMDGGIEMRKSEDMSFHGPFASVSIGLGG